MNEITYCAECKKPLYTTDNVIRLGFDPNEFCRSNRHLKIMTYLEYHGAHIFDTERLNILKNASFNEFRVIRHELYTDGTFCETDYPSSWLFLHNGQLYNFSSGNMGATGKAPILNFSPLNMDKNKCGKGNGMCGVYYEAITD